MKKTIPLFKVHIPKTIDDELLKVLHSGYIGQGPKVDEFEKKLGDYFGNKNVLTLNAGTSGLHLALRLSNVEAGDEVISTAMTCTATNMPILERGAKIVWADIDPDSGLISPESIKEKITDKTKAIMVVHFGGIPCDMNAINKIAKEKNIKVIEDGAHAFGAEYEGEKIGNHSDFIMFSLQAIKHITTIDGGLLLCKSKDDFERGKLLRWYGIDREQKRADFRCEEDIIEYGYKFHMNDIAATLGIEQLNYVDEIVGKHQENQCFYDEALKGLNGIKLIEKRDNYKSASWLYTLHVNDRQKFMKFMEEKGIMTSRVHERNDGHTCFKESFVKLPGLEKFNATQVSIPVGWWVSPEDRDYIVESIKEFSKL